eukprot:6181821-Pleurochrysis_carterae.AAC.1
MVPPVETLGAGLVRSALKKASALVTVWNTEYSAMECSSSVRCAVRYLPHKLDSILTERVILVETKK